MFKRLRQLRISLAAKCQILFGAAVVLIIGAALAVPWHRMEQLTKELNERTAGALADNALPSISDFSRRPPPETLRFCRPRVLPRPSATKNTSPSRRDCSG